MPAPRRVGRAERRLHAVDVHVAGRDHVPRRHAVRRRRGEGQHRRLPCRAAVARRVLADHRRPGRGPGRDDHDRGAVGVAAGVLRDQPRVQLHAVRRVAEDAARPAAARPGEPGVRRGDRRRRRPTGTRRSRSGSAPSSSRATRRATATPSSPPATTTTGGATGRTATGEGLPYLDAIEIVVAGRHPRAAPTRCAPGSSRSCTPRTPTRSPGSSRTTTLRVARQRHVRRDQLPDAERRRGHQRHDRRSRSTRRAPTPTARCCTCRAARRWPTPSTTTGSTRSASPASPTVANGPFPPRARSATSRTPGTRRSTSRPPRPSSTRACRSPARSRSCSASTRRTTRSTWRPTR